MVQSSFVCTLLIRLFAALRESRCIKILTAITDALERGIKHNRVVNLFMGHRSIEAYAESSVFYKLFGKIISWFFGITGKIYSRIRNINRESICERIYNKGFGSSFIFRMENMLALSVLIMMLVPHKAWNNVFALGIALVLTVFYILTAASGKSMGQSFNALWLPFLLFAFSAVLGVLISLDMGDSIRVLVFFVTSFLLCLCVYGTLTDYSRINKFTGFIYLLLIVVSVFALVQRIVGVEADASLTDLALNENMPGRLFGTLGNPNNFAEFLVMVIPVALAFALNIDDKKKKAAALIFMLMPFAVLLGTYSRSSWISFAFSMILFIVLWNRKSVPFWIFLVICLLPLLPESIWNRILTIGNLKDSSSAYRLNIWKGSFDMVRDYPLTGIGLGPGAFTQIFPDYALENTATAPHSHMQFLEVWIEMGIIGLISFIWLSVALVRRCINKWHISTSVKIRNIAAAGAASMAALTINGIFEYLWFYPRVMFIFFILTGLIMAVVRCRDTQV